MSAYTSSPGGWDPLRTVSFSTTAAPQSFPDAFGTGSNPAYTGAQAILQLPSGGAVFRIELVAPGPTPVDPENCCGDVAVRFEAQGLAGAQWGIDNLVVTAVPEPGTLGLLGLGLAGFCVVRRSRRHPPV